MVVTPPEENMVVEVVNEYYGRHSDWVLKAIMKHSGCGPTRAGNLLRHCVKNNLIRIDGFRVYPGGVEQ